MKPFDLEAAKRGEPIQAFVKGVWADVKFVGTGYNNLVVVEHEQRGVLRFAFELGAHELLRMRDSSVDPKDPHVRELLDVIAREFGLKRPRGKRVVFVNVYRRAVGCVAAGWFDDEASARQAAGMVGNLAIAVPVEIEE